jgi:hypothetical protein
LFTDGFKERASVSVTVTLRADVERRHSARKVCKMRQRAEERRGVGARSLNIELQAALNPADDRKIERPPGRQRAALVGQVLTKTSTIYFADKTPSHFRNLRKCSARPRSQRILGRFNEQGSAVHHLYARRNGCHSRLILCARLWGPGGCLRRAAPWSRLRIRARHTAIPAGSARAAIRPTSRRAAIRGISTRGPIRGISRDAAIRPTSHRPIWSASRRVLIAPIDR